ncbi:MAG TPA: hypothetical protein VKZ79_08145 [Alphaproteobacteria bacterium]|nr:hypothetical protein [Alphaproteobacteria bacterium]
MLTRYRVDPQGQLRAWLAFTVGFLVKKADRPCALIRTIIERRSRR